MANIPQVLIKISRFDILSILTLLIWVTLHVLRQLLYRLVKSIKQIRMVPFKNPTTKYLDNKIYR